MALTGANGSGKTSLLRAMAGLLQAEGDVLWEGQALQPDDIHWAGTDDPLKGDLTVAENLRFFSSSIPRYETLNLNDLSCMPVRYLSRGQVRRVSLSRLFLTYKPVWLLDEPETGLDEDNLRRMSNAVRRHVNNGGVAVIGTHRPDVWNADITLDLSTHCHPERSEEYPLCAARPEGKILRRAQDDNKGSIFLLTLIRDLRLTIRRPAQAMTAAIFFILAVALMPLGLAPNPVLLQSASSGLIGMAALFAGVLASDRLFEDDAKDGTLDALVSSGAVMPLYASARMLAAWIVTGLPLVLAGPVLGLMLGLKAWIALFIPAALLPASLLLTVFGGLCAALSGGARQGTVLLALLALPLYSPVLIFMAGAMELQRTGGTPWPPVLLLWAMLAAALPLIMIACGAMLKARVRH